MKKLGICLATTVLAFGMTLATGGTAFANYGPHGGYGSWTADTNGDGTMQASEVNPDTDACAGCHRAHTAVSGATWNDGAGAKNALLIGGTSTTIKAFCYTCHSDLGAGAATNVQAGLYDNSADHVGSGFASKTGYATGQSTNGATLNGGGFEDMGGAGATMTSSHEISGAAGIAWGEGTTGNGATSGGTLINMDCASCHDPHGSSNYRILKDKVNNVDVGGYVGGIDGGIDPAAKPYVVSNEVGYPTGGFRLHRNYGALGYQPDYTSARYAASLVNKGMSAWCAACHTQYNTVSSSGQGQYNASDDYGFVTRHRHPVNQPLNTFSGPRSLIVATTALGLNIAFGDGVDIPLEHTATDAKGTAQVNSTDDYIGCLTCHRAHGTDATMDGYANSASSSHPQPDSGGTTATSKGTQPTMDSALLRADNRGVCERCHNK